MAKNDFLSKWQAQKRAEIELNRKFTMQWCQDAALIAANEVFQRKGAKLVEFNNAFVRWSKEIAKMTLDDAKGDKSLEYTKDRLDTKLKELLGEDFIPWEERYNIF